MPLRIGIVTVVAQVTAVVQVRSLAWELLHDMGMAKKEKENRMGGVRGVEEKVSSTDHTPHLHQTVPQTSAPIWDESASFLIRKPNIESLELQVL